jgi:outer membrane protein
MPVISTAPSRGHNRLSPRPAFPTKLLAAVVLLLALTYSASAQRLAYCNTQYVLNKMPEYAQAKKEIERVTKEWEGEVLAALDEAQALEQALEAEKVLLTNALLAERKKAVEDKRAQARALQMKYFGPEGELFTKQMELVRPLQDQVFNAVRDVAKRKKLDFVFDQGSAVGVLYAAETNDISDEVLDKLGR